MVWPFFVARNVPEPSPHCSGHPSDTPLGPDSRMGENGGMAEDDIEKLLREINATTSGSSSPKAADDSAVAKSSREVEQSSGGAGGRLAFSVVAAGITGVGAFLFGVFTPWTDALDMGFAAAVAGFLTGLVAGPPRWFSS